MKMASAFSRQNGVGSHTRFDLVLESEAQSYVA